MTDALYEKLTEYVRGGGVLLMAAAHLSENSQRKGAHKYVRGGNISELFGCKITGEERVNSGIKFMRDSDVTGLQYPGTQNLWCDCNYPGGFADFARVDMTSGTVRGASSAKCSRAATLPTACTITTAGARTENFALSMWKRRWTSSILRHLKTIRTQGIFTLCRVENTPSDGLQVFRVPQTESGRHVCGRKQEFFYCDQRTQRGRKGGRKVF